MAIVISGVNNNDKITASDGTIDLLSGVNYGNEVTVPSFKVGNNIQIGNAGIITATTYIGNLTGNVNATSNLLLQIGGSEKFRVGGEGQLGIGGANYGTSGQVLTSGGTGSAATWSTISGTTINTNADNRIITGSGTANTLNGEANLTFDGTTLTNENSSGAANLSLKATSNSFNSLILDSNRSADTQFAIIDGRWNGNVVNRIQFVTGSDGTNKDDGYMAFHTRESGASLTERLRITSDGNVGINQVPTRELSVHSPNNNNALIHFTNDDTGETSADGILVGLDGNENMLIANQETGKTIRVLNGGNERFRIDSDGVITKPYQVGFYATANSGGTVSMTSTHILTNWRVSTSGKTYNIGSHFNTSNGRFTAPVAGQYLFTGSILLQGYDQATNIHMIWRKNGSNFQYWYNTRTSDIDRSGYGGYLAQGSTTTISMAANDYIDVACDFSGSLSIWAGDQNWGHFSGILLA